MSAPTRSHQKFICFLFRRASSSDWSPRVPSLPSLPLHSSFRIHCRRPRGSTIVEGTPSLFQGSLDDNNDIDISQNSGIPPGAPTQLAPAFARGESSLDNESSSGSSRGGVGGVDSCRRKVRVVSFPTCQCVLPFALRRERGRLHVFLRRVTPLSHRTYIN